MVSMCVEECVSGGCVLSGQILVWFHISVPHTSPWHSSSSTVCSADVYSLHEMRARLAYCCWPHRGNTCPGARTLSLSTIHTPHTHRDTHEHTPPGKNLLTPWIWWSPAELEEVKNIFIVSIHWHNDQQIAHVKPVRADGCCSTALTVVFEEMLFSI